MHSCYLGDSNEITCDINVNYNYPYANRSILKQTNDKCLSRKEVKMRAQRMQTKKEAHCVHETFFKLLHEIVVVVVLLSCYKKNVEKVI